jgi:hypothetical protein
MESEENQQVPVAESTNQEVGSAQPMEVPTDSGFSWQASEFVYHQKSAIWYLALMLLVTGLVAGLMLLKEWFGVALVVVMALAVLLYSRKQPRVLDYSLDSEGLTIDGQLNHFDAFRSYSVHPDVAWQSIDLEPAKRFVPRLTILCESENFETIEAILAQHLPRTARQHDLIERLTHFLKF